MGMGPKWVSSLGPMGTQEGHSHGADKRRMASSKGWIWPNNAAVAEMPNPLIQVFLLKVQIS